jgi:hypothetical protein
MKRLIAVALMACGSRTPPGPAGGTSAAQRRPCDAMRARVEQLYRAEAQAREPARVDDAVADNTAMVMSDCQKAPDKVAACIVGATTVKDLESRCLAPIDDEGTEGDKLVR